MPKVKAFPLSFWTAVIMLVTLNTIVFSVMIMKSVVDLKVQYIPDDAYYYLTLSRNFSSLGLWTFDSGVSVTSGFHPLFAYLLSIMFSLLHPDTNSFTTYSMTLSFLFALAAILVMWFWGFKHKNILFLMFLALVIGTRNFVYNTVSITEWSLTILISSLYCVWFFTKYSNLSVKYLDFLILFLLGFLGSLTRSDFGLLPFSIAITTFLLLFITVTLKRQSLFAFVGLMGSVIGLLVVFLHNYIFTNEILQSSAKMKAHWAQLSTPDYYAVPLLIGEIIGFVGLVLLAVLIATAILPKFIREKDAYLRINDDAVSFHSKDAVLPEDQNTLSSGSKHNLFIVMLISAGVSVLGCTLFYSRNAAIQPWYTANLIVPVLMLIFAISDYITASLHDRTKFLFSMFFLSTLIFNISNLYPVDTTNALWPHQKFMYDAGVYLKENSLDCRIGAWNAGIIGYYEGGNVINLDGLVNNDIYLYAVNNDLPTYLSSRDICYIIDFENMVAVDLLRMRGGYDDARFLATLKPQMVFDKGEYWWRDLTLYHIDSIDGSD